MSRIGNKPVPVPKGVDVKIEGNKITIKGSKGTLSRIIDSNIKFELKDGLITLKRSSDIKKVKALHGLSRALINNMVIGVSLGFNKVLEINGVGYRAAKQGKNLNLQIGYSHPVEIIAPPGIDFILEGTSKITVIGIDKELVGQIAADIRDVRPVEPYKGKGIKYQGEIVRRKAGKATSKASG